jgi:hypothetical protein
LGHSEAKGDVGGVVDGLLSGAVGNWWGLVDIDLYLAATTISTTPA